MRLQLPIPKIPNINSVKSYSRYMNNHHSNVMSMNLSLHCLNLECHNNFKKAHWKDYRNQDY